MREADPKARIVMTPTRQDEKLKRSARMWTSGCRAKHARSDLAVSSIKKTGKEV